MDLFIPLYAQLHFTTRGFLLIAVTVQREPNYIPSPHQNLANQLARFFDFQPKKGAIC